MTITISGINKSSISPPDTRQPVKPPGSIHRPGDVTFSPGYHLNGNFFTANFYRVKRLGVLLSVITKTLSVFP
ncbi:hypothetical protein SAMN05428958_11639 [Pantoea sesami]|nr:hypothetical protein SAMN05428958_11639 [Pantoea sesami]